MRSPHGWRAWLFMAPALSVLGLFTFYPIFCGVLLAFFDFNMLRHTPEGLLVPPRFVGLENFQRLLHDVTSGRPDQLSLSAGGQYADPLVWSRSP